MVPDRVGELFARYSFLEPLVAGRRVLELGAARTSGGRSAAALAGRGARSVLSVEEDGLGLGAAEEGEPPEDVRFAATSLEELAGSAPGAATEGPGATSTRREGRNPGSAACDALSPPSGSFDLVLVTEGASLAADAERVARLAALLSPGGTLVAALPAAGGRGLSALGGEPPPRDLPAYASFVGALSAQFEVVEVATQSAVTGWLVAPAAPDSSRGADADPPELGVDGAHGGAPEAAFYLALCGARPSGLAGMTLVTLPFAPFAEAALAEAEAARAGRQARSALAAARASEAQAADELSFERAARARLGDELAQAKAGLEVALRRAEAAVERMADLETSLDEAKAALDEAREALQAAKDLALDDRA